MKFNLVKSLLPAPKLEGYKDISTVFAGAETLFPKMTSKDCIGTQWKISKVLEFEGAGEVNLEIMSGKEKKRVLGHCKVTHVLDPVRSMQGYYSDEKKGADRQIAKTENPDNQSYVDAIACLALSQLSETKQSPHFCLCYGVYRATADMYRWNITDEYPSYRKYKGFWKKRRLGYFTLIVEREEDEDEEDEDSESNRGSSTGYSWIVNTPTSSMHSRAFSYDSQPEENTKTNDSHESIDLSGAEAQGQDVRLQPLEDLEEIESLGIATASSSEEEGEEGEEDEEEEGAVGIYSEMKNFPVMIIFQERMEDSLDSLIQESNSPETYNEAHWTAWIFQIIAAVTQYQHLLHMTHNDLHTNNVVYTKTDEEFLWYRTTDGRFWRVPTYGYLFKIIDFGRSIYKVQEEGVREFVSDDFARGGDAEGQYKYEKLPNVNLDVEVRPNRSFDLCRFAVSVLEGLYMESPPTAEPERILNIEGGWEQKETISPLFNMLWKWTLRDNGENVYVNQDGSDRYPNFDLYKEISRNVHTVLPEDQLGLPLFQDFRVSEIEASNAGQIYRLF